MSAIVCGGNHSVERFGDYVASAIGCCSATTGSSPGQWYGFSQHAGKYGRFTGCKQSFRRCGSKPNSPPKHGCPGCRASSGTCRSGKSVWCSACRANGDSFSIWISGTAGGSCPGCAICFQSFWRSTSSRAHASTGAYASRSVRRYPDGRFFRDWADP